MATTLTDDATTKTCETREEYYYRLRRVQNAEEIRRRQWEKEEAIRLRDRLRLRREEGGPTESLTLDESRDLREEEKREKRREYNKNRARELKVRKILDGIETVSKDARLCVTEGLMSPESQRFLKRKLLNLVAYIDKKGRCSD